MIRSFISKLALSSLLGLAALFWSIDPVTAQTPPEPVHIILHLLDYVAVDYPEFVQDGVVLDQAEYDEQLEFSQQARTMLSHLSTHPDKAHLLRLADELISAYSRPTTRGRGVRPRPAATVVDHSRLRRRGGAQACTRLAPRRNSVSSPMLCLPWSGRAR